MDRNFKVLVICAAVLIAGAVALCWHGVHLGGLSAPSNGDTNALMEANDPPGSGWLVAAGVVAIPAIAATAAAMKLWLSRRTESHSRSGGTLSLLRTDR